MRIFTLLAVITIAFLTWSCNKTTPPPVKYLVDTANVVYLNNNDDRSVYPYDSLHVPMQVRFITGNAGEKVKLYVTNLPPRVHVYQDTIIGIPTYTADFVFWADSAALGTYTATLYSYARSEGLQRYDFTIKVVNYNCSHRYTGTYTGTNACRSTNYTYYSTVTASGGNALNINNLGGYGTITNTYVTMDCNRDSLHIASQNIGNGVTVEGNGYFYAGRLILNYTARNTPLGTTDVCTANLVK